MSNFVKLSFRPEHYLFLASDDFLELVKTAKSSWVWRLER